MVTTPRLKEELVMYLCAAREAVSAVLLMERDSQQMSIYFVNNALQAPKINCSSMEKLVLALVHASRRLRRSSCLEGLGVGLIHTNPEEVEFTYALRFKFEASNNETEYEALINGSYMEKEQSMIQYLEKAKTLISGFRKFLIEQVPRSENKKADALSKIASTSFAYLTKQVLVEVLKEKSIEEREILAVVKEEGYCWMTLLLEYLTDGPLQAEYLVREIHEGSCSMHFGPRCGSKSNQIRVLLAKDARMLITP
ncbi:reverse transcriptase domain-containing protein [Tanacetum coccineum]|uniref:Reverse transcriptase domain-containing protein n=1 Tax=Tanacetum coccineum TaxID=301880 RepID=A0ABQ5AF79_9ASTR